jgi:hypothetical protein
MSGQTYSRPTRDPDAPAPVSAAPASVTAPATAPPAAAAPSYFPPTADRAERDPSWAIDPAVVEAHSARVQEILTGAGALDASSTSQADMLAYIDPAGSSPEMPDLAWTGALGGDADTVGGVAVGVGDGAGHVVAGVEGKDYGASFEAYGAVDQTMTELAKSGGHYTGLGNAIGFLGGPVGAASSTDIAGFSVGLDAEVKGFGLSGELSGETSDTSTYYSSITQFPVPGLDPRLDDPLSQTARQAYIDQHPEEFASWMEGRRAEVLGDAESLQDFDWRNLGVGDGVSFSERSQLGGGGGIAYGGIGVSLGLENQDVHEVTMAMSEAGMLDIAVTAMDEETATVGGSLFGELSLEASSTSGGISQVKLQIDTTTADGAQQAEMFTQFGILPGALDHLPAEERAKAEEAIAFEAARRDYPFGASLTGPGVDLGALVEGANAAFLDAHQEGDLPVVGDARYDNLELAEVTGSGATLDFAGLATLESSFEQIKSENRYRNEQGLTESEYGVTTSIDRGGFSVLGWQPFGDGDHVDSFALTNPEFNEDLALFAGITGDYGSDQEVGEGEQAALTVALTDDQMDGVAGYLDSIGASEEALFNESSGQYYFNGDTWSLHGAGLGGPIVRGEKSYEGHDGETWSLNGNLEDGQEGVANNDAAVRAGMTGLTPVATDRGIELYRERFGEEPMMVDGRPVMDDRMTSVMDQAYQELDAQLATVTSVDAFRALADPALQSAYIQSAAMRLTFEEKNPTLALGLAFELEDADQRNEVIRDVLAHLPEDGVEYFADLVKEAGLSDPELAQLLDGAVEEGVIAAQGD